MRLNKSNSMLAVGMCVFFFVAFAPGADPVTKPAGRPTTSPTTRAATKPTTTPATRPQAKMKEPDPLRVAISELSREAQTALQQRKPFPRTESDYFKTGHKIEAQALLKTLAGPLNQNPRVDAYVKFQLLSAFESFSDDLALPALKAYVLGSPALIALPGVTHQEQQKWTQKALQAKQDDVAKINEEWKAALAPYEEANTIILAYRDLMKSKIDAPLELKHKFLQASLEDLSQRGAAGFEITKPVNALAKTITAWGATAKREQIKEMLAALKEYTQRRPPKMLEELRWRNEKATWTTHDAGVTVSRIEKIRDELEIAEKNALE